MGQESCVVKGGKFDFNQFDFFLMTYRAIELAMETLMIVSRECLQEKERIV